MVLARGALNRQNRRFSARAVAPVSDSCGMAGGSPVPVFNGGEYVPTKYGKQGELGSHGPGPPGAVKWPSRFAQ